MALLTCDFMARPLGEKQSICFGHSQLHVNVYEVQQTL